MMVHTFFAFLVLPLAVTAAPETYQTNFKDCPVTQCGDVNITYPFWYSGSDGGSPPSPYCGYKGFGISCLDGDKPTFRTWTDNYTAESINPDNKTISLVDPDVVGKPCPKVRHNVTLGDQPSLYFTPEAVPVLFFFNCSGGPPNGLNIPPDNNATCLQPKAGLSYVFNLENQPPPPVLSWLTRDCKEPPIVSRVRRSELTGKTLSTVFGDAMKNGFDLKWIEYDGMADCKTCESNGGRCGYSNTTGGLQFHCFCPNGKSHCYSKGGVSVGGKLIIGLTSVSFGIGCVLIGCFCKNSRRCTSSLQVNKED